MTTAWTALDLADAVTQLHERCAGDPAAFAQAMERLKKHVADGGDNEPTDAPEPVEESLRESRKDGEVWQGPSGRYFTMQSGHVVPHAGPGGGGHTPPASHHVAIQPAPAADAEPVSRPSLHERAKELYAAGKAKLTEAGKALYEKLPPSGQRCVDMGQKIEHWLEGNYKAGQELAKAVAAEQGKGEQHVERVGRILAIADGVARWTTNIPVAHHAIEALAGVGGPVAFFGAKAGYYVPVASLGYVGWHLGRAALGGQNPLALIESARQRIKAQKEMGVGGGAVHESFDASDHPRGQPGNAGQFGPGGGASGENAGKGPESETPKKEEPAGGKESWQMSAGEYDRPIRQKYPKAGKEVDGRKVVNRDKVDNLESIGASLDDYDTLPGIREVSLSEFTPWNGLEATGRTPEDRARVVRLAEKIEQSGKISPLIVVHDDKGAYILEGGHRFDALNLLGAKSFPAVVVIDRDKVWRHREEVQAAINDGHPVPPEVLAEYPDLAERA